MIYNPFDNVHSSSSNNKTSEAVGEKDTPRKRLIDPVTIIMSSKYSCSPSSPHKDDEIVKTVLRCTDLCIELEDYPKAETLLRTHLSCIESTPSKISLMNKLSSILCSQDKFRAAIEVLLQAHDLIQTLPKDDDLTAQYDIVICCKIACLLSKNNQVEKAVIMFHEALAKIGSFSNQQQSMFCKMRIEIHKNIAQIYESIGIYSNAIDHLEQLSVIATEVYGPMDPLVSNNLNHLGLLYYKEHEYDLALSVFLKCLQLCTSNKRDKNQLIAVLYNVATVYKVMGMMEDALKIYLKILGYERQMMQEDTVKKPTDLIRTLRHIFEIYTDQEQERNQEDGMQYLLEAVDLCRQYMDEIDSRLGQNVFFLLGKYLTLHQEVSEGFRYFCEGSELFGEVDLDTVYAADENGLRIILAHLCTSKNAFPLHAAAA